MLASRRIPFDDISVEMMFSLRGMIGKVIPTKLASSVRFIGSIRGFIRWIIWLEVIPCFRNILWTLHQGNSMRSIDIWVIVIVTPLRTHGYNEWAGKFAETNQ
jgi:hypothetical protein